MKVAEAGLLAMVAWWSTACGGTLQTNPGDLDGGVLPDGAIASGGSGGSNASGGRSSVGGAGGAGAGGIAVQAGATGTGGAVGIMGGSVGISRPPPMAGIVGIGGGMGVPIGGTNGNAPPPQNCQPASSYSSASDCQVDMSCDNDWVYTSCYLQSGDTWYCDCGSNYRSMSFQLSGSDSSTVCSTIADLCSSADPITFTDPEMCSLDYQNLGSDYCDLGENCTRTVDAGNGITAKQSSYNYANCYMDGSQLTCSCSTDQAYQTYLLSGFDVSTSCGYVMDLCDSGTAPVFDQPANCTDTYQDTSDGYCYEEQQCRSTSPVSDGVTAVLDDYRYADCQDLGTGSASCNCSTNQGYMRFEMDGSASSLNTCSGALQVCADVESLTLSGPITCSRSYQSASGGYCDAQLTCKQAGDLGGQQLLVYGDLYVNCNQDSSSGAWSCSCSSGQNSATFDLSVADGWDVCSMAADSCPNQIDVQIGMSGGGGFYRGGGPVPLPVVVTQ